MEESSTNWGGGVTAEGEILNWYPLSLLKELKAPLHSVTLPFRGLGGEGEEGKGKAFLTFSLPRS